MNTPNERRRHSRMALNIPVTLRTSDGMSMSGRLSNLSSGGAGVILRDTLPILLDEAVELELEFSSPGQIATQPAVEPGIVRYRESGTVGIQFKRLWQGLSRVA
jgi:c-di-GMP-binding flagellar brake protein YcgR